MDSRGYASDSGHLESTANQKSAPLKTNTKPPTTQGLVNSLTAVGTNVERLTFSSPYLFMPVLSSVSPVTVRHMAINNNTKVPQKAESIRILLLEGWCVASSTMKWASGSIFC